MKKLQINALLVATGLATVAPLTSHAAIALGYPLSECRTKTSSAFPCCCQTGQFGTEYTCPKGWKYSHTANTCQRNSTISSDAAGYYTQTYGTCAAKETQYETYIIKTRDAADTSCMCLAI